MIIAGLTGGIATGKTTVSNFLNELGAHIIDADKIAHNVVKKKYPAWEKIVSHFGKNILLDSGEINRENLGKIIFNNPSEKNILNKIVHPYVFEKIEEDIKKIKQKDDNKVIILDVPLLIETKMHKSLEFVIVVYVPLAIQLIRLMARDNTSKKNSLAKISSQISIEEKKQIANIVINNSKNLQETKKRTFDVYSSFINKM